MRQAERLWSDRGFWKAMVGFGLPLALQNLLTSSLQITDNFMVGQLGEQAIGALALANQISFLVILFAFGVSSGIAVFAAQYWGAGDVAGVKRTQGLAAVLAVSTSAIFFVGALFFPEVLMGLYSPDPAVQRLGSAYLRISAWAFPLTALSIAFSMVLRSVGQIGIPLRMSIVALVVNLFLNWVLIFGQFGLPAMGVEGSALGTLLARVVEAAGLVWLSFRRKLPNVGRWREMFYFPRSFVRPFLTTALPVLANEMGWSLGFTTLVGIYAHISSTALAAVNITETLSQFINILIYSSVNATAILTGNLVGAGRLRRTVLLARRVLPLAVFLGLGMGLTFAGLSLVVPAMFNLSAEARSLVGHLMLIFACCLPLRSLLFHQTVGLLRGGGDTRLAMVVEVGGLWVFSVPLAWLGAFVLHQPVQVVFLMAFAQEAVFALVTLLRFRGRKWIRQLAG